MWRWYTHTVRCNGNQQQLLSCWCNNENIRGNQDLLSGARNAYGLYTKSIWSSCIKKTWWYTRARNVHKQFRLIRIIFLALHNPNGLWVGLVKPSGTDCIGANCDKVIHYEDGTVFEWKANDATYSEVSFEFDDSGQLCSRYLNNLEIQDYYCNDPGYKYRPLCQFICPAPKDCSNPSAYVTCKYTVHVPYAVVIRSRGII